MKTLIIPDVHDKVDIAQAILDGEVWDRVVFLGDFFDDFPTGPKEARRTALWLKKILEDDRVTVLLGNHEIHYLWPYLASVRCSGYSKSKSNAIGEELAVHDIRKKFKLYEWVDDWLLTHAGISRGLVPTLISVDLEGGCNTFRRWFESESVHALDDIFSGNIHPFLRAGYDRGGLAKTGGVIWCDWNHYVPIPGVKQLVGHTPASSVRVKGSDYCLDTHLKHYAIIEDGNLTVYETAALLRKSAREACLGV